MSQQKFNPEDSIKYDEVHFSLRDINTVVNSFYTKISNDEVMKVPFHSVADWPEHMLRMTNFWWIKFGGQAFSFSQYNPIQKHYYAGFNEDFLERWVSIFEQTLKECVSPEQQKVWFSLAKRIGAHLTSRNELYKKKVKDLT